MERSLNKRSSAGGMVPVDGQAEGFPLAICSLLAVNFS